MSATSAGGDDRHASVLVVDDSTPDREMLVELLESDPGLRVVGAVSDATAAVAFVRDHVPDVILMARGTHTLDGFEATRMIMETRPVPIVLCGASTLVDVGATVRATEAGALACIEKPERREQADFERLAERIRQTVTLMSEVKVVRRWARARLNATAPAPTVTRGDTSPAISVVGVGASTGGPQVLQEILARLPARFPVPILIVQHIARGFLPGLVDWLNGTTPFQVTVGAECVMPQPGHVYLAPDDVNMGVMFGGRIHLSADESGGALRPSVSHLFQSLAEVCGPTAVGVLLTGMGKDGAAELRLMRDSGAITIAQDGDSAVVNGMPAEAVRLGGAMHVWPPHRIAAELASLVAGRSAGAAS